MAKVRVAEGNLTCECGHSDCSGCLATIKGQPLRLLQATRAPSDNADPEGQGLAQQLAEHLPRDFDDLAGSLSVHSDDDVDHGDNINEDNPYNFGDEGVERRLPDQPQAGGRGAAGAGVSGVPGLRAEQGSVTAMFLNRGGGFKRINRSNQTVLPLLSLRLHH